MVAVSLGIDGNRGPENIGSALEIEYARGGYSEKYSGQVVRAESLDVDVIVALHFDFNQILKKSLPNSLVWSDVRDMGHTGRGVQNPHSVRGGKIQLLRKSGREVEIARKCKYIVFRGSVCARRVLEEMVVSKIFISLLLNPWLWTPMAMKVCRELFKVLVARSCIARPEIMESAASSQPEK